MEDTYNLKEFYAIRELARLGLWQHASFYAAEFEDNLQINRSKDMIYYTCKRRDGPWYNLLWMFT